MAYQLGRFVWFELVTPDVDDAKRFWTEAAGFGTSESDVAGQPYLRLQSGDQVVGGVVAPRMEGVPPHVTAYLSVADVDAAARAVVEAGGRVIVPGTDLPIGRFAVVADPQGATFQLWRGRTGDEGAATGVRWMELWTGDAEAALGFYQRVFGFGRETMQMPSGPYHMLQVEDTAVAGVMTSPDAKVPPMWLPYLLVEDVDQVVANARRLGGAVHAEPMSVEGVGRFAIVADRQGLVAGVLKRP
ncbi:MAG: VOC family protein [Myxococcota bacterium]